MSDAQAPTPLTKLLASLSRDGRGFEHLAKWFLENDPEWKAQLQQVWLWDEWPGRWGPDRGIDLIGLGHDGQVVAIQAKNYGESHSVTKRDIDTFLSESNRSAISARLLIATTDRVARSATEVMREQEKPVSTCLLSRLRESAVAWPASLEELRPLPAPRANPLEHQIEALAAIARWARTDSERGQVIMACGTGKTLVGIWAADQVEAQRVLVLVPTIALLRQATREWCQHASTQRALLQICSDTAHIDEDLIRGDELGTVRTTDPKTIAKRLREDALLVVCTYESSRTLAEAMRAVPGIDFDLAVADEAHRCAGLEGASHKTILDATAIRAGRRLFFTATPTIYGTRDKSRAARKNVRLASMDDRALFGPVIHHLSFAEAISRGLLCPYQVAVIPIDDDEVHQLIERRRVVTADGDTNLEAGSLATQIACARAMRRFACRRVVAFHPTIVDSKRFSDHFPVAAELLPKADRPVGTLWSRHVDGAKMPHATRAQILEHFKSPGDEERRLLSNVRVLTEGVDVRGIDAIAFVDTRRSQTTIIQAVGRAVRTAPDKTVGTIVLPIVLRAGESFEAALARSEHRGVVDVLGALRSHDPEIIKSLDDLRFDVGPDDRRPAAHGRFVVDAPLGVGEEFADAVDVALTTALGFRAADQRRSRRRAPDAILVEDRPPPTEEEAFLIGLHQLETMARWQLLPAVPQYADGFPMTAWWTEVKKRWAAGTLDPADKGVIANSVSWLARDLDEDPNLRAELAALTDADLPEQIAAQLRPEGRYAGGILDPLIADGQEPDELIDAIRSVERAVTHAATSPEIRLRYVVHALGRLGAGVSKVLDEIDPDSWYVTSSKAAVIDGFRYELALARAGDSPPEPPKVPWTAYVAADAHEAGREAARPLTHLAERIRLYQFAGDANEVEARLEEERSMVPNDRLDALGWDIYLLSRARDLSQSQALIDAMKGNYRERSKLRRDLLNRSIRIFSGPHRPDEAGSESRRVTPAYWNERRYLPLD